MDSKSLVIHGDLMDYKSKDSATCKFCAPIFLTPSFGIFLDGNENLLPKDGSLPKRRNGTLTFVEYKEQIYGITCRHVTDILESENKKIRDEYLLKYGINESLIQGDLFYFFIPHGNNQIHINSRFHPVSKDSLSNKYPDVSIAKIKPDILRQIGRRPIPINENHIILQKDITEFCGIATGYAEQNRKAIASSNILNTISIPCITIYSSFASLTGNSLILFDELREEPDADNLSGMSGGPILWSSRKNWGLAGIIKEGKDLKKNDLDSIKPTPGIWIEGERIVNQKLIEWIKELPKAENYLPNRSKRISIPTNYNPKR